MQFEKLETRLKSEGIPFNIYNTGGGCFVLFVDIPDGSQLTVSPSEEEHPDDPSDWWLVCYDVDPTDLWNGESVTLSRAANAEYVVRELRSRGV